MEKTAYILGVELALRHAGFSKEATAQIIKQPGMLSRFWKFLTGPGQRSLATDTASFRKFRGGAGTVQRRAIQRGGRATGGDQQVAADYLARLQRSAVHP